MEQPKQRQLKTKPYTLRAIRKYYDKNKEFIKERVLHAQFMKRVEPMIALCRETADEAVIVRTLYKITTYKQWQKETSREIIQDDIDEIKRKISQSDLTDLNIHI